MEERLKLEEGHTVRFLRSRETGFRGERDVSDYEILDAEGNVVGSVQLSEHMAVRGFRVTNTVVQKDAQGNTVHTESWNP